MPNYMDLEIRKLPYRVHRELSALLDIPCDKDWKALISALPDGMYTPQQVSLLALTISKPGGSPSSELLTDLGHQLMKVHELVHYLESIDHQEAMLMLRPIAPVSITKEPQSVATQEEFDVTLTCDAEGFPKPVFQWFKDNSQMPIAYGKSMTIKKAKSTDVGEYSCKITNQAGSEYTRKVTIQVTPRQAVPTPPQQSENYTATIREARSVTAYEHQYFVLRCDTKCEGSFSFQWYKNGCLIPGATGKALVFVEFQKGDAAHYCCKITGENSDTVTDVVDVQLGQNDIQNRQFATSKIALLIANQQYIYPTFENKQLVHPMDDALALEEQLSSMGFSVICLVDLTKDEMEIAVTEFTNMLKLSPGSYGLFYFCGHGFEENGKTYLVPVDAPKLWSASIALSAEGVLSQMQASKTKLDVLLLDVCRLPSGSGITDHSLKTIDPLFKPGAQSVFGYATCPQSQAFERTSDRNGLYMKQLIQLIQRDEQIELLLHKVGAAVRVEAERNCITSFQSPTFKSSTTKLFSLQDKVIPLSTIPRENNPIQRCFERNRIPPSEIIKIKGMEIEVRFESVCSNVCNIILHLRDCGGNSDCDVLVIEIPEDFDIDKTYMNIVRDIQSEFRAKSNPYTQQQKTTTSSSFERVTKIPNLQKLNGLLAVTLEVRYRDSSGNRHEEFAKRIFSDNEFGITSLFNDSTSNGIVQ